MPHTISTVGDRTTHGGTVITGSPTRMVQGKKVARLGDMCSCPIHGKTRIVRVLDIMPRTDGLPTAHSDAMTACGAKIIKSPNREEQGPAS